MGQVFEDYAEQYSESLKRLPRSYIRDICARLGINQNSVIADLGCGSGLLTYELAQFSNNVIGLDISHNMIEIAKAKLKSDKINWVEADIDAYEFPRQSIDALIAYESFHLFPNIDKLIKNSLNWLKPSGILSMGWCVYCWEILLKDEIISVFQDYGVIWGEWGYQRFEKFRTIIDEHMSDAFLKSKESMVKIKESWSVAKIVNYLSSISKAEELGEGTFKLLNNALKEKIISKYGKTITGYAQYWLRYAKRKGRAT